MPLPSLQRWSGYCSEKSRVQLDFAFRCCFSSMHLDHQVAEAIYSQHVTQGQDSGGAVFGDNCRTGKRISRTQKIVVIDVCFLETTVEVNLPRVDQRMRSVTLM